MRRVRRRQRVWRRCGGRAGRSLGLPRGWAERFRKAQRRANVKIRAANRNAPAASRAAIDNFFRSSAFARSEYGEVNRQRARFGPNTRTPLTDESISGAIGSDSWACEELNLGPNA